MAEIVIRNLRKEFGAFTAVKGSSFTIGDGEFFMLLGPSGCGKTTTLRMIAGLELPSSGEILIDGEDVSQRPASQRDIAMVFQMFALYPHLNVRKNISYPLVSQGLPRAQIAERVDAMLKLVQLEKFALRKPHQLSGGQQQRVAIARAVIKRPRVLLLDEPLSALDAKVRVSLRNEIRDIQRELGITTIFVTHDQEEAMSVSDRIVVMNGGIAEQAGAPFEIYNNPRTQAGGRISEDFTGGYGPEEFALRDAWDDHVLIFNALSARDPERAAEAMQSHMARILRQIDRIRAAHVALFEEEV